MQDTRIGIAATALSLMLGMAVTAASARTTPLRDVSVATAQAQESHGKVIAALIADGTPRALMLASMLQPFVGSEPDAAALIERARASAPDDAFVQWFAAMRERSPEGSIDALYAMQRLEPDNGSVWILALDAARRAGDEDGVAESMSRLAAATRDDERLGELTAVWLDFYERHPELLGARPGDAESQYHPSSRALIAALGISAAMAIPAYQSFTTACTPSEPATDLRRASDCALAAARMAERSPTMVGRAMGYVVLRKTGDARLESAKRHWDYLQWQSIALGDAALSDPREVGYLIADWRETRSEVAVLERQLARAGLPSVPPADWKKPGDRELVAAPQQAAD